MPLGRNQVLGNRSKSEAARPHRVALANWPAAMKDKRTESIDALLGHLVSNGYEGVEFGIAAWNRYFTDSSPLVVARKARKALEAKGLQNFGSTLHFTDEAMRKLDFLDNAAEQIKVVKELSGEYASYQLFIHPDYAQTGGAYREDERYLQWCARVVTDLRSLTWDNGLNFYLEVHVDRMTEDPAACCRILDMATCELNGDMSHYLARGFLKGKHVQRILKHVGHTHVRMARVYGDLSAAVDDPKTDWANKGVTWQAFQFMKPALDGGISSRCIVGETGPMHLVKDTLTLDASLVPLYRAMARYADASAQGVVMKVDDPADLKPWG